MRRPRRSRSPHPALIEALGMQERRGVRQEVTIPLCSLAGIPILELNFVRIAF